MSYRLKNVFSPYVITVLKDRSAGDVARTMIESDQQKHPFYIFDFDAAYKNVKKFKEKLPRVQIFYAMKANDHEMLIKLAVALGLGFDCASPGEIDKIRKYNVRPTSIIYAAPLKTPEQMLFAKNTGVRHTTFDSIGELQKLKEYWPDSRSLIRIKLESNSVYQLGNKFGLNQAEAEYLLDEAADLGLTVIGVAFHVGSGCFSEQSYVKGLQIARALFDREMVAGRKMSILDIGGGFFDDGTDKFDQVASLINEGLDKWFPEPDIQVIAEPGRYICESAFTLYSSIRATRTTYYAGGTVNMVYLNNGINGTLMFLEKWHFMKKFQRNNDREESEDIAQDTIIWGPTPDDTDFFGPIKLTTCSVKDWLVFYNQGAYTNVFENNYCGLKETLARSVISSGLWIKLRDNPVFSSADFVMDSTMPAILTSNFPSVQQNHEKYNQSDLTVDFKNQRTHNKKGKVYVLDGDTPNDVAKAMIEGSQQTQAFYIFNMDEVYHRVQHFRNKMPRVNMFYAMKSNDTEVMLRLIAALGLGFSCVSPGEIHKIKKLSVDPENIIYTMPSKTTEEMEYAREAGMVYTSFDDISELEKIQKAWPDARLLIRIGVHDESKNRLQSKFGCHSIIDAKILLDEAARLHLNVVGVTFHVSSISYSPQSYVEGLHRAKALFDYEAENGRQMSMVDIGGGFLSGNTNSIDEVSYLINSALEELFPDPTVKILAEPGRYVCDSAFKLYCSFIGIRKVVRNNAPVNMIYLKDGVYGTMRYDEPWHKLRKFQQSAELEPILDTEVILWGPSCDCVDRVRKEYEIRLPQCTAGDWLVIENHGAYTIVHSTSFSSLEMPLIRTVISKNLWTCIKNSSIYNTDTSDFTLSPDISSPLPSTLPLVTPFDDVYNHQQIPSLIV